MPGDYDIEYASPWAYVLSQILLSILTLYLDFVLSSRQCLACAFYGMLCYGSTAVESCY